MAKQSWCCDEEFSAPEFISYDISASAPELDFRAHFPQLDQTLEALQLDTSETLPERRPSAKSLQTIEKGKELAWTKKGNVCGLPWKTFWIAVIAVCITVLGVGVGTGLELGLQNGSQSPTITSTGSPSSTKTYVTRTVGTIQYVKLTWFSSLSSSSTSFSQPLNEILEDSSLAAIDLGDGLRRVFFQDSAGNICQSVYDNASKSGWQAPTQAGNITDGKKKTPLAVTSSLQNALKTPSLSIFVRIFVL